MEVGIVARPGVETINVTIAHTEHGGDEDGVVNLKVGCAFTGALNVFGRDAFAALLHLASDLEKGFQLSRDFGVFEVALYRDNESFVAVEVMSGDGSVDGLAIAAIILRRDVGGDEFALAR